EDPMSVMMEADETAREQMHDWRQEAFDVWHAPKLQKQPTVEDESYAYHLSEKLRTPDNKRIVITQINADEATGEVVLYVQADNVEQLKASQIMVTDNQAKIAIQSLEKISESVN